MLTRGAPATGATHATITVVTGVAAVAATATGLDGAIAEQLTVATRTTGATITLGAVCADRAGGCLRSTTGTARP
ncbi:hypothetical protein, partial [Mycolicibacter arupensis]|uniref:hypothetical protein n=1 Tax=Mycolicibacter arupensis TaxID=342002 RepID=UPI001A981BAC